MTGERAARVHRAPREAVRADGRRLQHGLRHPRLPRRRRRMEARPADHAQRLLGAHEHSRKRYWARSLDRLAAHARRAAERRASRARRARSRKDALTQLVTQNVDGSAPGSRQPQRHRPARPRRRRALLARASGACRASTCRPSSSSAIPTSPLSMPSKRRTATPRSTASTSRRSTVPACEALRRAAEARRRVLRRERAGRARAARVRGARAGGRHARRRLVADGVFGLSLRAGDGRAGKPIAAVNLGRTRADDLLALKVTERCADALSFLLDLREGKEPLACIYR